MVKEKGRATYNVIARGLLKVAPHYPLIVGILPIPRDAVRRVAVSVEESVYIQSVAGRVSKLHADSLNKVGEGCKCR